MIFDHLNNDNCVVRTWCQITWDNLPYKLSRVCINIWQKLNRVNNTSMAQTKRIEKLVMASVSNWHNFSYVSFNINRKRNEKIIVVDWCVVTRWFQSSCWMWCSFSRVLDFSLYVRYMNLYMAGYVLLELTEYSSIPYST